MALGSSQSDTFPISWSTAFPTLISYTPQGGLTRSKQSHALVPCPLPVCHQVLAFTRNVPPRPIPLYRGICILHSFQNLAQNVFPKMTSVICSSSPPTCFPLSSWLQLLARHCCYTMTHHCRSPVSGAQFTVRDLFS